MTEGVKSRSLLVDVPSAQALRLTPAALLARNATLNLIGNCWNLVVLVIAMPKLVHCLGETSFGLFSIAWISIGYLTFLDIGVNRAATKFVSEHLSEGDHDSASGVVRTAIVANLSIGIVSGVAIALLSPFLVRSVFRISDGLYDQAHWTFYAVSLAVPVLLIQGVFRAALSSLQRFGWINGVDSIASGAQWLVAVILARKGYGVALVVFSTVLARLAATIAYGVVLSRAFSDPPLFRAQNLHGLSKLLRFGGWVTVSQLISPLLVYLDRVLIASFVSLSAVTLYTVPFEAMARLRIIPAALVGTLYPAFSERGGKGQHFALERLYERAVRYLTLLLVPGTLFLLVLGPDLFRIWMGASFARETASVVEVLAFGVLVNALAPVPYNLLQALGRPDLTGKFHLLELPLYVAMCLLLIPRWGIAGAALASTVRFSLDAALLFWAAGKYCGCSLRSFWMKALPGVLTMGAALGLGLSAIRFIVRDSWPRLGLGVVAIGLSLLAAWAFAVDSEEKPRLNGMLRNLLGQRAF